MIQQKQEISILFADLILKFSTSLLGLEIPFFNLFESKSFCITQIFCNLYSVGALLAQVWWVLPNLPILKEGSKTNQLLRISYRNSHFEKASNPSLEISNRVLVQLQRHILLEDLSSDVLLPVSILMQKIWKLQANFDLQQKFNQLCPSKKCRSTKKVFACTYIGRFIKALIGVIRAAKQRQRSTEI